MVGAIGSSESIGYTLYYTTNFIFTGLAVAVAFHAGLFNIGGEGQAYIGGLGCGLAILALDRYLPAPLMIPLAILAAALFGAAWAAVPAWLQAWRGSHIVITTIMFNFLAAALMVYLMVNVLIAPGSMTPQSRNFAASGKLPSMHDTLAAIGIQVAPSALNLSIVLAVLCCIGVWVFLWHTPWGYALRTMGHNPEAAVYAGTNLRHMTMLAMCISGGLAGFVGVNELMGVHHRIVLDFPAGYGFAGIAVALMGRSHPVGIVLAALLFGALQQGGTELAFEIPTITREMVVVIQGLIILFSGALVNMPRPWLQWLLQPLPLAGGVMDDLFSLVFLTLAATLRVATPLVLCAMGGLFSEKSGIIDVGLEGKMLMAAFFAAATSAVTGSAWAGVAAAIIAAEVMALLHGFACITHRGNQVVSGVAINIIAAGLTVVWGTAWFNRGGQTPPLVGDQRLLPLLLPNAGDNILVYAALLSVPLTWWIVERTRFGLRLRAVGEMPLAVDTAGISVPWLRYRAVLLCGLFAGLAGAYLSIAQNAGFSRDMTAGQGFIALAAIIFGKWRPFPAFGACLIFGLLDAIAIRLQGVRVPGVGEVPVQLIQALPYLLTVFLLAGFIGRAIAPRAAGVPYQKEH